MSRGPYEKRFLWGVRFLVMSERDGVGLYAARVGRIPVGVPYHYAGNGWGVVDVELAP